MRAPDSCSAKPVCGYKPKGWRRRAVGRRNRWWKQV